MYLLGYDIGSSSVKAALVEATSGKTVAVVSYPEKPMEITAIQPGWAEQDPDMWWINLGHATRKLLNESSINASDISGIGIAYQMHGLVLINKELKVLRPSIIWCDSRAVDIGEKAFKNLGREKCLKNLLNSPGNFTASKLRWVKENEPDLYLQVYKILLPGDFIAMKMTGEITTTISGLSEGIFWDFNQNKVADFLLDYFEFEKKILPDIVPTFSNQGNLTEETAKHLGLQSGIPVTYRAGDQPNNALSLNVLQPGEVAATGGTSGVMYAVVDQPVFDPLTRVNGFVHVNHSFDQQRIGTLLCINGTGIQYDWIRQQAGSDHITYQVMEQQASQIAIGSDGLITIPFGNGTERMLENRDIGAHIANIQHNIHTRQHLYRATLEGIAFAFIYGMEILNEMGIKTNSIRVGNDNLFQSDIFSTTISTLSNSRIEVVDTTGAIGAAKAAGIATGYFDSVDEAMQNNDIVKEFTPELQVEPYKEAYFGWKNELELHLKIYEQ